MRTALLALDDRLQAVVSLKAPVYTADPNVLSGEGVYSAGEWGHTRRVGADRYAAGRQYADDESYLRYIAEVEGAKISSALSLTDAFDFSRYRRIFEMGCGDMIQALQVTRHVPGLQYVATDFDPYVIERCGALPVLAGIEKRVFNVLEDSTDVFAGFDLIVSWGLDATLDDRQFLTLLASVGRLGVPYLMCSPTTIGPLIRACQWSAAGAERRLLEQRRIRMHGWARSIAYFKTLAATAGLGVRNVGRHGLYTCLVFDART